VKTRISELLGIEIPIVQAPMSWIARAPLASAVSNAGGAGIIETGSGELDAIGEECAKMRAWTDRPWGINVPLAFVRDPTVVDFVINCGSAFVTTSAGDPAKIVPALKASGLTVFHVVPSLKGAMKALDAGVDGLVVEGVEGGGYKNAVGASLMVLLPLIRSHTDVPIIAAGGICDGVSMAAALVLGADGVQMGTRMLSSLESPVHQDWKDAVVAAAETDTVVIDRPGAPAMRALRTETSLKMAYDREYQLADRSWIPKVYFGGELDAGLALGGQVMGRIDAVRSVADILPETWRDCQARLASFAS
jgi:enoyl-[acyl-carrier protein] reductase II